MICLYDASVQKQVYIVVQLKNWKTQAPKEEARSYRLQLAQGSTVQESNSVQISYRVRGINQS